MIRRCLPALLALLLLGGCALWDDQTQERYYAWLAGGQVTPQHEGAPFGSGLVELRTPIGSPRFCYSLRLRQVEGATAVHLHRGLADSTGPELLALRVPGASGRSEGCVHRIGRALWREMRLVPDRFYVDVHTVEHPHGALRGQLRRSSPTDEPLW